MPLSRRNWASVRFKQRNRRSKVNDLMKHLRLQQGKRHLRALYPIMLFDTALFILRERGIYSFVSRLIRWLRGERRYRYKRTDYRSYQAYQAIFEPQRSELARQREQSAEWAFRPLFGIITAVHNTPLPHLHATYQSLRDQSYDNWVWYVADASNDHACWDFLLEQRRGDERIRPNRLTANRGISANTNEVLHVAESNAAVDYVVMLDHDDTLAP